MNNEIIAWIQTTDDSDALRVLRHSIDERLADLGYAGLGGGGGEAAMLKGQDGGRFPAQTMVPTRRTEPGAAGVSAYPITGPGPAPVLVDQLRAHANAEVMRQAAENMKQAGGEQQARAMEEVKKQGEVKPEDTVGGLRMQEAKAATRILGGPNATPATGQQQGQGASQGGQKPQQGQKPPQGQQKPPQGQQKPSQGGKPPQK
jgi:hypothetical protein